MTDLADLTVTIVDGYVDEPAHFGVPPYVSTYPRFIAGVMVDAGVPESNVVYHTIDELHEDRQKWRGVADADLMVYIGGMTVPDKYTSGTPAKPDEVREPAWVAEGIVLMGGPIRFGVGDESAGGQDMKRKNLDYNFIAKGNIEATAYDLVDSRPEGSDSRMRDNEELDRWVAMGAFAVEQHPSHPDHLICKMETSWGCAYRYPSCTEPSYGNPAFRATNSAVKEAENLHDHGARHFRLGRQASILVFGGDGEAPNPDTPRRLYGGIREVASDLGTLHSNNVNSITIIDWPEKSCEAFRIIAEHNMVGNTAVLGLEPADPVAQKENSLNITADECFEAVKTVNEVAGWRPGNGPADASTHGSDAVNRLPKPLPGINFLHGLRGECEETFEHNKRFLQRAYDEGLMVRRINVRQVMAFDGTDMSDTGADIICGHKQLFKTYKTEAREEIDRPMFCQTAPARTVLPNVHLEYHQDGQTLGHQLGTYPLLVGTLGERELGKTIDVVVIDHGYRSVTGVPYPLDFDEALMDELTTTPGTGRSTAGDIMVNRPYADAADAGVDADVTKYVQ